MSTNHPSITPVPRTSADPTAELRDRLRAAIPEYFADGQLDLDRLRAVLGQAAAAGPDRYTFTWAGKQDAIRLLQTPTTATLVPARDESLDWDTTQHLFIEGDNLEVLKLLYKAYYGRVKMIYIDPPYNTGNDYVYNDDFVEPLRPYLSLTGQMAADETVMVSNPESSGRFHSTWLSMMYPRLFVARQLISEDGIILISIDDNELDNLRLIMNELFGEENFIATLVWEGALKNDSRFVSISHDYIVAYARNKALLSANQTKWRTRKEGIDAIYDQVEALERKHGADYPKISAALRRWYSSVGKNHPAWQHRHYSRVDERGVYFPSDISWPGGGGPDYGIIHPVTGKMVRTPARGWVFPSHERMAQAIADNRVDFGPDESNVPTLKRYLHETEGQVLPSVIYKDRRAAMKRLRDLFGDEVFDNPKDEEVLVKFIEAMTQRDDVVMDFFAGSSTTAHAVLEANRQDHSNRRFVMVQIPQPTPINSGANRAGYPLISDIGKERIRRVVAHMQAEDQGQLDLSTRDTPEDLGFRVFKLAPSHFKSWAGAASPNPADYTGQMDLFTDPLHPGWQPEAVIWEVAIKEGFSLTSRIETAPVAGHVVYRVADPDKDQHFHICLDDPVTPAIVAALQLAKDDLFICRDSALDDTAAANLSLQCRLKTI